MQLDVVEGVVIGDMPNLLDVFIDEDADTLAVNHGDSPHDLRYAAITSSFSYLDNISNHLSQQFYGAKELTAYELKGGSGPIMQCRHCIRYALGYCVKHGGKRPTWREPLSLVLGDGRRFRLEFDCQHCQMNIYSSEQ